MAGYKGNVRLVWSGESKVASEDGAKFQSDLAIWVGPLTFVRKRESEREREY